MADENGGKLDNRVVFYWDEVGTIPKIESAEIIIDNCQDTIFGGSALNSESAEVLSKSLGNKTVMSGPISRGKNDPSQSF